MKPLSFWPLTGLTQPYKDWLWNRSFTCWRSSTDTRRHSMYFTYYFHRFGFRGSNPIVCEARGRVTDYECTGHFQLDQPIPGDKAYGFPYTMAGRSYSYDSCLANELPGLIQKQCQPLFRYVISFKYRVASLLALIGVLQIGFTSILHWQTCLAVHQPYVKITVSHQIASFKWPRPPHNNV
jgi:hypothetical protein